MKKRYARILAATLSAAMVFTSAPVNFTGIDLGVIEAKAANLSKNDIEGKFPVAPEAQYGKTTIVAQDGKTAAADATDMQAVSKLSVGQYRKVTFTYSLAEEDSFDTGVANALRTAGYDVNETAKTVSKDIVVTVIAATATSTEITIPAIPKAESVYKTGTVTLYDAATYSDPATKVTNTDWVVDELADGFKDLDASDSTTNAVTIRTKKSYKDLAAKYDVASYVGAYTEDTEGDFTYDADTGYIKCEIDAIIKEAKIDPATIEWPTALTKTYVAGDNMNAATLVKTATSDFGAFTYAETLQTSATAGEKKLTLKFTPTANKYVIDSDKIVDSRERIDGGVLYRNAKLVVNVGKKVIKTDSIKNNLVNEKYPYGTTYGEVIQLAGAAGVTYEVYGKNSSDVIPVGTHSLTVRAESIDNANVEFENGSDRLDIPVSIVVEKPEIKAELDAQVVTPSTAVTATLKTTTYVASKLSKVTYQWYTVSGENETAIQAAKGTAAKTGSDYTATYTPSEVGTYVCKFTMESNSEETKTALGELTVATTKVMAMQASAGGATIATPDAKTGAGVTVDENNLVYGDYKNVTVTAQATYKTGTTQEYAAYFYDADGKKVDMTVSVAGKSTTTSDVTAAVPAGLNAGTYTVVIQMTQKEDGQDDVVVANSKTIKINQKTLNKAAITVDGKVVKFDKDSYVYGTKTSEFKFTEAKTGLGTFSLNKDNDEIIAANNVATLKLDYNLTDEQKKNYTLANDLKPCVVNVKITRKDLKIKADDVTITLGDKLPELTNKEYKVEGLVGNDSFDEMGSVVKVSYASTAENNAKTVGEYKEAIRISATALKAAYANNYNIVKVEGTLIVKDPNAKPSTPPTVAPTPAPVKQSVAAKAKAVKSKATVKVGKKYTLKVKFAAGKKSTVKKIKWTSSKKKVATVSSKGKVTAKKAGKATIYARVYFKDGSMKKIKFTVTVK